MSASPAACLIGWPAAHSRSPIIHKYWLRTLGLDGDYRIVRPGSYVRCAVTGDAIPLDELKYWSVERQEAYAGPDAVMQRLGEGLKRS